MLDVAGCIGNNQIVDIPVQTAILLSGEKRVKPHIIIDTAIPQMQYTIPRPDCDRSGSIRPDILVCFQLVGADEYRKSGTCRNSMRQCKRRMHDIAGIPFPHSCTGKAKVLTRFISCCVDGPCRTACNILQTALHCPALFHHLRQKIDLFIPVIGLQKQTKQRMPLNILLCDTLLNSRQYPFQKLCIARPLIGIAGVDQPHTDTGTGYC